MNVSAAMKNLGTSWLTKLKSVKIKPCTLFLIKTIWVYPFFAAGLYMASSLFISSPEIRLIISVVLGIFPWKEAMKKLFSNSYRHTRTQLLVMLQNSTTRTYAGSLHKCIQRIFDREIPAYDASGYRTHLWQTLHADKAADQSRE